LELWKNRGIRTRGVEIVLYVSDPLCFKESILISLEALSDSEYNHLKEFVEVVPSSVGRMSLDTSKEVKEELKRCINNFKETKTYHYLREDFKNSLFDIELQVN
jgi:hypothetical protein